MAAKPNPDPVPSRPSGTPSEGPAAVDDEYQDAEQNYKPKSLKFWSIMLGMYLAMFLVALDRTIIATALASISNDFNSIEDIGWYGSAYMLTNACSILLLGKVYRQYSTKVVYLASIVIFEAGSALCGAAPTSSALIAGRAIAGFGAAGIQSGGMMIILPLVPLRKRPVFVSIFGMVFGVSSVLGPILGGAFTDHITWRWCFYINLPIGAITIVTVLLFLHLPPSKQQEEKLGLMDQIKQLDPLGLFFFVPAITSLILALQWGGSTDPWSAPRVIGLLVTAGVLLIGFIIVQVMMPETAMAPMRVVLDRSIAGSMLYMSLLAGAMLCVVYYITLWFQAAQGVSPLQAGIRTIPLILSMMIAGFIAAGITQKTGYYVPVMLISPLLATPGAGMLTTLTPSAGPNQWIGYQVLYGMGIGFGFQSSMLAAQTVLPRRDVPIGVALQFFMQQLGGAVFLAVGQNLFSSQLVSDLGGLLDPQIVLHTGATELHNVVPPQDLGIVIDRYSFALTRVFVLGTALSAFTILGALCLKWVNIKKKEGDKAVTAKLEEGEGGGDTEAESENKRPSGSAQADTKPAKEVHPGEPLAAGHDDPCLIPGPDMTANEKTETEKPSL
ncbi:azole resistance protein [Podospora didyma]|uniref:Azole resistance protein n=1 Tax=Podospora didyma TaxID=330526 RepID=A0AAE0NX03_9PEZI|nr:azole resistance protein [Podospora didyma]